MSAAPLSDRPTLFADWRAAQDHWDALLDRQQAALDGRGLMPPADAVRKARQTAEAALAALEART